MVGRRIDAGTMDFGAASRSCMPLRGEDNERAKGRKGGSVAGGGRRGLRPDPEGRRMYCTAYTTLVGEEDGGGKSYPWYMTKRELEVGAG